MHSTRLLALLLWMITPHFCIYSARRETIMWNFFLGCMLARYQTDSLQTHTHRMRFVHFGYKERKKAFMMLYTTEHWYTKIVTKKRRNTYMRINRKKRETNHDLLHMNRSAKKKRIARNQCSFD